MHGARRSTLRLLTLTRSVRSTREASGLGPAALLLTSFSRAAILATRRRVPAALEGRGKPQFDHPIDQPFAQEICRKTQDVRVVVAVAYLGGQIIVARRGAHAGELVGGDAHAQAGAADQDPAVHLAVADFLRHRGGDIRVVDRLAASAFPRPPTLCPSRWSRSMHLRPTVA